MADPQVLIAGAGPTGLAAALFLTRQGVPVRIVDPLAQPIATSKALGVNPRTLALLDDTGVTAAILAEAQAMRGLSIHRRGRSLAEISLDWPALGADHPMVILPQARTEALLTAALAERGVTVRRGVAVQGLTQTPDAVTARLSDGSDLSVPILFAADGAHSPVRKTLGLDFPGDAWEEPWHLLDVDLTGPPPDRGWIDLRPWGPFVCLPFSGSTFRLIGPGPDLLDRLPDGWTAGTVHWRSDFRISHRMVERMSVGRVCLGGDAAHIHSPIGARGMNLGIEDAFVFAACAADALNGQAGRLDDYGRLRHTVDAAVVRNVRALTSLVRDTSPAADLGRRLMLPLAARLPFVVNRALKVGMGLDHPVRVR
ncbi:MAG: FAD-dependent monooxygenase [Brevundimonas sp.]|uniref:FAD-dependent oxidoreductase n=1 Tax=Brevundimonas sp. TaxID=1871086 RepID=UPI0025C58949|nr:FAD-dependent monooxygenase [Brevundimonas sp.]MBX3476379.1 FAD-dependent monooxygenase [Brevundimonas sp.]